MQNDENNSTQQSARDTEYMQAVENNDLETAQRMIDELAEEKFINSKIRDEDGKLIKVYHGTDAQFTVFDKSKGRSSMDIQGMFFSPWDIDAKGYGPNVRAFYLNISNPADERTGFRTLNKYKGQYYAGIKAREDLESMGYDGVNNEDEEYIAFNSTQIKSADPVTYDDDGNVIPLSKRFNEAEEDIRYSVRDNRTDYTNTDLSTLDDKQLKVYNNRGWANSLFTDEDRKLLNEKYSELNNRTKHRSDNVLGDGSRVVEVNNKLVLIGGTYEDPIIYNVLAINADNETEAEIYKELMLDDIQEHGHTKQEYIDKIKAYELYSEEETFRNYESADFEYHKGQQDTGQRALLPDSFKSYGYTKQFTDRRRDSSETEQGISSKVENIQNDIGRGKMLTENQLIAQAENKVTYVK